ncbi:MAG TPA: hypothetical protein VHL80_08315 [Polyangia bacterium]|nr:hypothetical protein [Polyangia bacterium]
MGETRKEIKSSGALGLVALAALVLGAVRCGYSPNFPNGTLKCSVSERSCPEGYACDTASDTCFKNGELPGQGGSSGAGGKAGAAGSAGATGSGGAAGAMGTAGAGGHGGSAGSTGVAGATGTAGAGGQKGPPCAGTCTIKIDATLMNANAASPDSKFVGHWVYNANSTETVTCSDGSDNMTDLMGDFVDVTISGGVLTGSYFCNWSLTVGPAGNATIIKPGQSCSRNVTDKNTGTTHFTWHGTTFTFRTDDSKTGTLNAAIGVDYIDDPAATGCAL